MAANLLISLFLALLFLKVSCNLRLDFRLRQANIFHLVWNLGLSVYCLSLVEATSLSAFR